MLSQNGLVLAGHAGIAGSLAFVAGGHARAGRRPQSAIWITLAVTVGVLAVDRAVGFSDDLANNMRRRAHSRQWYNDRRTLQIALSVGTAAPILAVGAFIVRNRDSISRTAGFALLGVTGLTALRAVRSVSLHDVDVVMRAEVGDVRVQSIVEYGLMAAVAVATAVAATTQRSTDRLARI